MSKPLNKLVILARDGVINHAGEPSVLSPEAWIPISGSLQAIARLNQAGYRVAVATNQTAMAQGLIALDTLNAMHHKLHDLLDRVGGHVDVIAYCPHGPDDGCGCHKPEAGMFHQIAERFGVDLAGVAVIGSQRRDLDAALAVGARPMLVLTGNATVAEDLPEGLDADIEVFDDLAHAVNTLLVEE